MMDVDNYCDGIDDLLTIPPSFLESDNSWNKVGDLALPYFATIATSAYIVSCSKKKRVLSPFLNQVTPIQAQTTLEPSEEEITPNKEEGFDCSKALQEKVKKLFSDMADKNVYKPWVAYELYQLGEAIKGIHPFALLKHIPKDKMQKILEENNPLKVGRFIKDTGESIQKFARKDQINCYLDEFAASIDKPREEIMRLIEARDYSRLIHYLFDVPYGHAQ